MRDDVMTFGTQDQRTQTCTVPPSPELRDKWRKDLASVNKSRDAAPALRLAREPHPLGFNDGVIVPPEEFPAGTPFAAIRATAADRAPLRGTVNVAVVLVDFSDKTMTATTAHFDELFFSTGALPHGSVKEYYSEVTNGLVTLAGTVVGPYRMPHTLAWYANNGSGIGLNGTAFRSPQLALDAANAANAAVDFTPYDNDGNGFVDAFIVVHAGQGAEVTGSKGDIWSHKSVLASALAVDSTKIYGYLTIPEDAKIGVSAHELGHLLFGFPDLYDTDYSSEGIGNWCLMSGGSWNGGGAQPAHPSAWCKVNQGWVTTTVVTTNGTLTIPAVESSHTVFRLWKDGASGSEYFLLENRQPIGYDAALPGPGALLWHIDETQPGNTDENHYKVALIQADGKRDLELDHNRGDAGDPFPGSATVVTIDGTTTPGTKSYAGADTCVALSSISPSGAVMTANVRVTCKSVLKDLKDARKELKKDSLKDQRKEIRKEVFKEVKEFRKDTVKDVKEAFKDIKDQREYKNVVEWPGWNRPGGGGDPLGGGAGGGGFGGGGFGGSPAQGSALEDRLAALESVVYGESEAGGDYGAGGGGADAGTGPFIDQTLRPDLIGAPGAATGDAELAARMAEGDPTAKHEFDTPVR
ncbi:M6 family metalloprotease domain-containing protein [Cellulomonas sp. WB94]|uniref:M6 family metalloprotease domain-containing protein n=1 Tax=Cellulomonas sp. WB94 TaxID=2173174 RepID=UPI001F5B0569|nr:M6 family metalloprotease domain-containing protein [Cellulomonas sp. WB94]